MNTRTSYQTHFSNSEAIRNEIQRFEGVHPSIYAIYDLIELAGDTVVAQRIRDHVVCIEDSFVNSQEWTLSRDVPDLRLGIVGSLSSCKSALVHRYLTGSYMQEESPEGGRFKKEILVEGKSYLLLIRDEGGPPEQQFTAWVDAVIFVFSVENESSFNAIYTYYTQMAHFRKSADIPFILVGTQDAICETNPRVIDESRARKLATDLKRCTYWETCATYGLHVERVFEEACQKIVQQRNAKGTPTHPRPLTPNAPNATLPGGCAPRHHTMSGAVVPTLPHSPTQNGFANPPVTVAESPSHTQTLTSKSTATSSPVRHVHTLSSNHALRQQDSNKMEPPGSRGDDVQERWAVPAPPPPVNVDNNNVPGKFPQTSMPPPALVEGPDRALPPYTTNGKDLPTPSSTPTTARKTRRRSNLFAQKKSDDKLKMGCELGSGRDIPAKQGLLSKRSSTSLNKYDYKKKYVIIRTDGTLIYYPSVNDYIAEKDGKEINLLTATVKKPGQMPCSSKAQPPTPANSVVTSYGVREDLAALSIKGLHKKEKRITDKVLLTAYDLLREPTATPVADDEGPDQRHEAPSVKKRHKRMKSIGTRHGDSEDADKEFIIISPTKQWHFMACDTAERDDWVRIIEEQILSSIQALESIKVKSGVMNCADTKAAIQYIRTSVPGNGYCADCNAANPEWASLNLGILICIQCSGIHRNLGSHISKVRSLQLDDWPLAHTSVMVVLGNKLSNSIWEFNTKGNAKPTPDSSPDEKVHWIRSKYETREFIVPPPAENLSGPLFDSISRSDMKLLVHTLAYCSPQIINGQVPMSSCRSAMEVACEKPDLAIIQLLIWNKASVTCTDDADELTMPQVCQRAWDANRKNEKGCTKDHDQAVLALLKANGALDGVPPLTPPLRPLNTRYQSKTPYRYSSPDTE